MHPSYAVINLSKLKSNFYNIRKKTKNVKIMAVVKADAYGHGMTETARFLNSLGKKAPEYFAVAFPDEGIILRKANIKKPILVFEPFVKDQVEDLYKYNLIATVFSEKHLKILKDGYKKHGNGKKKKIKVHIKIDTGMNRLGIYHSSALDFIRRVSEDKIFEIDGIYTHFANSEEKDKSFPRLQTKRLIDLVDSLKQNKIKYGLVHAANSGAVLDLPEAYFDMVRPGILMFGYYPSKTTTRSIKLDPVMSIISHVSSIKLLRKGDTVGYGRNFLAKKDTNIISVPLGYADGFYRALSGKAKAIIKGKFYPQIGNVSMDRITFDIGNDKIKLGERVTILGKDNKQEITAWDWCNILDTIPYEVVCGFKNRIERVYKN